MFNYFYYIAPIIDIIIYNIQADTTTTIFFPIFKENRNEEKEIESAN